MKKTIYSALLVMALSVNAFAEVKVSDKKSAKKEAKASSVVLSQFSSTFKGAEDVSWEVSSKFQKATFIFNGEKLSAYYNFDGELLGTTKVVEEYTEISPVALKSLVKSYPGYSIAGIVKYSTDETAYYFNLKNEKENFVVKVSPDGYASFFKNL
ncbi:hypothetical protein [Adhaeribacter aquaticus]|uniref:hypothetical protein n=1 Tax=Adhaeribacter aquaticus TaxID=299567 RepID=UPI000405FB21|nr:hypothetical protein [Adhaeribacter aquaticus]